MSAVVFINFFATEHYNNVTQVTKFNICTKSLSQCWYYSLNAVDSAQLICEFVFKIILNKINMGLIISFLSIFSNGYYIPSKPIKFIFQMLWLVLRGIPKIIGAMISYVYFPPEPKNVEGKLILVCKIYNQYLTL